MHIISRKALRQFWERHPDSKSSLSRWFKIVQHTNFRRLEELRVSAKPFLVDFWEVVTRHEFQTVGLVVLILVLIVGVFFPYKHFIFATFIGAWFLTWLFFFDIETRLNWLIGLIGGSIALLIWTLIADKIDELWKSVFLLFLLLAPVGFLIWWFWDVWVPIGWLIGIFVALIVAGIIDWAEILKPLSKGKQESGTKQ